MHRKTILTLVISSTALNLLIVVTVKLEMIFCDFLVALGLLSGAAH